MRNVWIICRKELSSYFVSPIAYVVLTVFAVFFGFFFWSGTAGFMYYTTEAQMRGEMYPVNINEELIKHLIGNVSVVALFFIPLLAMRLFAEEKRSGTLELLVTSPIRDLEVVLGKWLACVLLYAAILLLTSLNFIWLFRYGNPDWKPLAVGYLGLLLQAAALLALGSFISTLTSNQIVAGAVTFGLSLLLWVVSWVTSFESATWARVLANLSVLTHFESFSRGVLSLKDAVYYVSATFLGLFLTTRSMESLRWRS